MGSHAPRVTADSTPMDFDFSTPTMFVSQGHEARRILRLQERVRTRKVCDGDEDGYDRKVVCTLRVRSKSRSASRAI